jgi:hypothetical protein
MFQDFFERRRALKQFSELVSEDFIEDILSGEFDEKLPSLKEANIEYVLVGVRGETPALVSQHIGIVVDTAMRHGAIVDSVVSALVVVTFGMLPFQAGTDAEGNRFTLVNALQQEMGAHIKIVHGAETGCFGSLGSETRTTFSFLIPGFLDALGVLGRLEFGAIQEMKHSE